MARKKNLTPEQVGIQYGFRSGLEAKVSQQLEFAGVPFEYEELTLSFIQPEKVRKYTPDFCLMKKNGEPLIVETKGIFTLEDRQKMLWVKEQYPDLDIRIVFSNSKAKLRKGAKSSYADWCNKNEYKFADKFIPQEWIDECQ